MEIIKNERGGVKLCHEGFMYTKKNKSKSTWRWECSQRSALYCKGAAVTDIETTRVISTTEHNHAKDDHAIQAAKLRCTMKENVSVNRGQPGQILADTLQNETVEVRAALGKTESMKRTIRRHKKGSMPKEPRSTAEFVFPEQWKTTGEPYQHPFLLYDNGPDSERRMLVFGTEQGLRHLAQSDFWFMDGTHQTAPRLFQQIYIIRASLGESAVTCVYALLSGKSQETYEELFQAIQDKSEEYRLDLDPLHVVTDFELAAIRGIRTVFGGHVSHRGCFYHLAQNTYRKIQDLGLTEMYKNNDDVKLFCGMIDALAFLPVEDVLEGMVWLRENTPAGCEGLINYFDKTYVSGSYRRIQPIRADGNVAPVRVRRNPPLFEPALWNVHQATIDGTARTNNQNANGEPPRKRVKKVTKNLQDRLRQLCLDYVEGRKDLTDFLTGCGQCIRWKV